MRRRRFGGDPAAGRSDNDALADTGPRSVGVGQWRSTGAWAPAAGPDPARSVLAPDLVRDVEAVLRSAIGIDDREPHVDVGLDILTQPATGAVQAGGAERTSHRERAAIVSHARRWESGREAGNSRAAGPRGEHPRRRVAGRHAASGRRVAGEKRYVRTLLVGDFTVGVVVAAADLGLRSGAPATPLDRMPLFLPVALVVALGLAGAYESRFLFVGADECRRVIRAGLSLLVTAAVVSYATRVPLALAELLVAVSMATVATAALRLVLRHRLRQATGGP